MQTVQKAGSRPPWVGLAAAVWVQFGAGNAYTFPLYSSALKSVLGFNQQQLTILGVAVDIGENVGILPGIACNKFPPWMVLFCGAMSCFFGYGVIWLAVSQTIANIPYWVLWVALVIATSSNAWFGTAVLVTNMRNFPLSRGTVSGILKGYSGVSATIFTEIFTMALHNSASELLLFLTVGVPMICMTLMYFIRPCTPASGEDSSEQGHFLFTQVMSLLLGVYCLTTTILGDTFTFGKAASCSFIAVMIIMMVSPLAIPVKMTLFPSSRSKKLQQGSSISSSDNLLMISGGGESDTKTQPLLTPASSENSLLNKCSESDDSSDADMLLALGEGAVKKKRRPRRGDDFKFKEALVKADFWLLWIVYFVGVGTGVTVLNNLAQIGKAQGIEDTTILLSLFAFGNFLGRLSGGAVSEHFVRSKFIPRTVWMTVTQIVMALTFLLYASSLSGILYLATLSLGICYGFQFSIMIPTVSELFGLKNFGLFYNFMLIGNPVGAVIFSAWLAGYLYDVEAAIQGVSTCTGSTCFMLTFFVLAGASVVGAILSVILSIRIRPVYQMLYGGSSFSLPQTRNIVQ